MRTARLATPGILLGTYPERETQPLSWRGVLRSLVTRLPLQGRASTRMTADLDLIRTLTRSLACRSSEELLGRVRTLRAHLGREGCTDTLVTESLALASIACARTLQTAPYDTQLIAARLLLEGRLAEMATGEGKTLAVGLAAATAALAGIPVHVVTANDYLVKRDAAALRPLYAALGLSVGDVTPQLDSEARRAAYACDITYCTAKELVFDYLRDRASWPPRQDLEERAVRLGTPGLRPRLLRGLCMAIIDEADSVLIDEARMPLVLSRAASACDGPALRAAWGLCHALEPERHFVIAVPDHSVRLTEAGRMFLRVKSGAGGCGWLSQRHCEDVVTLALTAAYLLKSGRDYLVRDDAIHIIDPTTGRTASGRAWARGLHQFVELKESIEPGVQTEPLIQITYQRFFARYLSLCGISGTLAESRSELARVYGKRVVAVPLRCVDRRKRLPSRAFARQPAQLAAVVARVRELNARGQPVLVGMDSVTDSEALSRLLKASGLRHAVLNARQDRDEASIIATAGHHGAITVATNMAGRGTDIILGPASAEAGGLHVICCQQNPARRIDRQLLGRCGRQGDPGSFEVYIALDGPLLAHHWLARLLRARTRRPELTRASLGAMALRFAQRARERSDRKQREWLLRRDEETGEWLAFSGRQH
ncbi:MAG: preprotein translocase subunit SecA [Betaproteobacteria bacterium]